MLSLGCSRCKSLCGAGLCQTALSWCWWWVLDGVLVSDGADTALVLDGSVRRHWNRKALVWSAGPEVVSDDVAEVVVAMVWAVTAAAEGWWRPLKQRRCWLQSKC